MKNSAMRFGVCAGAGVGLLVAVVAAGQRAVEPQEARKGGVPAVFAGSGSNVAQGFTELVTTSKNGDAVWVYSLQTGHWHKQTIPDGQGRISPTIGTGVVAFRTRTMIFACSSQTGAWDSIEVGELPGQPTVGRSMATLRAGNKIYAFSSETGAWDSVELAEGEVGNLTLGSVAMFETGSKVYAFSPKTGHWAMVDRDKP